jgi:hypothetical protein
MLGKKKQFEREHEVKIMGPQWDRSCGSKRQFSTKAEADRAAYRVLCGTGDVVKGVQVRVREPLSYRTSDRDEMIYVGLNGKPHKFKQMRLVYRSITFGIAAPGPGAWTEEPLLEVVWERTRGLCEEIRIHSVFRDPETKVMWRTYNLFLRFPEGPPSRMITNRIIWDIEQALVERLGVILRSTHEAGIDRIVPRNRGTRNVALRERARNGDECQSS